MLLTRNQLILLWFSGRRRRSPSPPPTRRRRSPSPAPPPRRRRSPTPPPRRRCVIWCAGSLRAATSSLHGWVSFRVALLGHSQTTACCDPLCVKNENAWICTVDSWCWGGRGGENGCTAANMLNHWNVHLDRSILCYLNQTNQDTE